MRRAYNTFEQGCEYLCSCIKAGFALGASTPGNTWVVPLHIVSRAHAKKMDGRWLAPDATQALHIIMCDNDGLPLLGDDPCLLQALGIQMIASPQPEVRIVPDRHVIAEFGEPNRFVGCQPLVRWQPATVDDLIGLSVAPAITNSQAPYLWLKDGGIWDLRYTERDEMERGRFPAKRNKGLGYYAKILARPHRTILPFDILGISDQRVRLDTCSNDEAIDLEGLDQIRRRRQELLFELDDPRIDRESEEKARDELEKLNDWLKQNCRRRNHNGEVSATRDVNGRSHRAKAKNAIDSALRRARQTIGDSMPELAKHLRSFAVPDGGGFCYCPPDPAPLWLFE